MGQNTKRWSQKQLGHPLISKVLLHDKYLSSNTSYKKDEKKQTNPNMTPKILMSSNRKQKSMKGKEPRGKPKGNQAEYFKAGPQAPQKWIEKQNGQKQSEW